MENTQITKIKNLIKELNEASDKYYNTDTSIMSDKHWDSLFDKLKALETETGIIFSNSPTQNVGYEVKTELAKVEHSIPLKSLSKTKDIEELKTFINSKEVLLMLKGDGLTCELIYNNGHLQQSSTRGNSIIGENITHNTKTFKNIPLQISHKGYLKLAGEAVIFDKDFWKINNQLNGKKYPHSRNLVAGSVRQLDSKICANRNVNFLAFSLLECKDENGNDINFTTLLEQFKFLNSLGLNIIPYIIFNNNDNLEININCMREFAKEQGIPIDGIVTTKYNNLQYGLSLGETTHHPLNAIAFKFYDRGYETKYIKTEWQVSRTGMLNPVGIFQKIDLDGASTTRATLHNIDYFKKLQLGEGDVITVARQHQVIPKILDNKTKSNTEKIPSECPICHSKTEVKLLKTAKVLMCSNDNCPSKKVAQIEHYCSRDAMNIVGLSGATIGKFIDKGLIKDITDIYNLEQYRNTIINMEGFEVKSYNKLIQSINKSKNCNLFNFIYALGIPNVGLSTAKDLANYFKNINNFMVANFPDFLQVKDIGNVTALSINQWLLDTNNRQIVLEKLLSVITIKEVTLNNTTGVFTGLSIYCTGTFACGKKAVLKKMVEDNGGIFANGYAKKLNYLVVGSIKGSSKQEKAKKDKIQILTEDEFLNLINK